MVDQKDAFVPRSNLKRTLSYRPHLKWIYYFFSCMGGIWLGFGLYFLFFEAFHPVSFIFPLYGIASLFLSGKILKPLAFSKVHVAPEGLTIHRDGKKIEIPYKEITSLKMRYISWLGGYFVIKNSENQKFRLNVVLERSEYVIESVFAARPDLFTNQNIQAYRRLSIIVDHEFARLTDLVKSKKTTMLFFLFVAICLGSATAVSLLSSWITPIFLFIAAAGLSLVSVMVCFGGWLTLDATVLGLYLMARRRKKLRLDPTDIRRELQYEKSWQWLMPFGCSAGLAAYFVFYIAFVVPPVEKFKTQAQTLKKDRAAIVAGYRHSR